MFSDDRETPPPRPSLAAMAKALWYAQGAIAAPDIMGVQCVLCMCQAKLALLETAPAWGVVQFNSGPCGRGGGGGGIRALGAFLNSLFHSEHF